MPSDAVGLIRSSLARWKPLALESEAQVLPLGIPALDAALPAGGLPLGGVTELQIRGASGVATSFALAACRAAQQRCRQQRRALQHGSQLERDVWCAFIDPGASLFAPGVARIGVDLSRLLVTRPAADAIERVAVRIAEANVAAVLVVDLRGALQRGTNSQGGSPGASPKQRAQRTESQRGWKSQRGLNEHSWQRTVRRLSLAIKSSFSSVLLITESDQFQSMPLPTLQRLELTRRSRTSFELKVAKERTGRASPPRVFPCSIFAQSIFEQNHFERGGFPSPRGGAHHQAVQQGFTPHLVAAGASSHIELTRKVS